MNAQKFADLMAEFAGGQMTVQTRSDIAERPGSGRWHEFQAGMAATHSLRMTLPGEITFDIGDCNDRDCAKDGHTSCWAQCTRRTHALWLALNRMGLAYWGGLSGGKGSHTHVFGPVQALGAVPYCANCMHGQHDTNGKYCGAELLAGTCRCATFQAVVEDPDWRRAASAAIVEVALAILGNPFEQDFCDYRLLAPRRQMQREFGEQKTPLALNRKVLWTVGPGPFLPLPAKRQDAYANALSIYPEGPPAINDHLPAIARFGHEAISCGPCPVGPQCVQGHPSSNLDWFGTCETCPMGA